MILNKRKAELKNEYESCSEKMNMILSYLKQNCPHKEIVHYVHQGWDRDTHSYECTCCKTSMSMSEACGRKVVKKMYL